jgi:hypothetical protein
MATLTAEQFRKMFPQANNEPVTGALATGLQTIADPLNQYRLPESMPAVGGMSVADFTGLTGAQGVLQDFSRGNLQSGDMRMFDLLGLGAGAAPAARTALKGGGLLGKEALRQMNEGTGLLGKVAIDPRQYMFIGENAKTWNPAKAKEAVKLEKKGISPEEIWKKTGTVRGVDGKLRQEISDAGSKITDNVYEGIVKNKRFEGKMGDALTNPELYKAYPDTADIGTGMYAWKTPEGSYDEISRTITAGGAGTTSQRSAALHELQHDIQRKEGFATGGTSTSTEGAGLNKENIFDFAKQAYEESIGKSGQMSDDQLLAELLDKPFTKKNYKNWGNLSEREKLNWLDAGRQRAYRRLAGEAEARLTQNRMNLTPEQRLQYFPYNQGKEIYGLDVPLNELIVRGVLNN